MPAHTHLAKAFDSGGREGLRNSVAVTVDIGGDSGGSGGGGAGGGAGAEAPMSFRIEIDPLRVLGARDPDDTTVSEAIESVYYRSDQVVRIYMGTKAWAELPVWGGVSDVFGDVVGMLTHLELGVDSFDVSFLCSCFSAVWRISESDGVLSVRAVWTEVVGMLDGRRVSPARFGEVVAQFDVDRGVFVAEWRKLLGRIVHDLLLAGYGGHLDGLERLRSTE